MIFLSNKKKMYTVTVAIRGETISNKSNVVNYNMNKNVIKPTISKLFSELNFRYLVSTEHIMDNIYRVKFYDENLTNNFLHDFCENVIAKLNAENNGSFVSVGGTRYFIDSFKIGQI